MGSGLKGGALPHLGDANTAGGWGPSANGQVGDGTTEGFGRQVW